MGSEKNQDFTIDAKKRHKPCRILFIVDMEPGFKVIKEKKATPLGGVSRADGI